MRPRFSSSIAGLESINRAARAGIKQSFHRGDRRPEQYFVESASSVPSAAAVVSAVHGCFDGRPDDRQFHLSWSANARGETLLQRPAVPVDTHLVEVDRQLPAGG